MVLLFVLSFVMEIPLPALSVYLLAVIEVTVADSEESVEDSVAIWELHPDTALLYTKTELHELIALWSTLADTVFHVALYALMSLALTLPVTVFHTELCELMALFGTYPDSD